MHRWRHMTIHEPAADLLPPATLSQARALRDDLARLLSQERAAAAGFLAALADFDGRRGWEPLGHASLFGFLHRELGLSKGAAFLRFTAVRLMHRCPEVAEVLRSGQLCLSAVGELARVMTPENRAEVLPKFFGCSAREAREVAAALLPRAVAPTRELVTRLPLVSRPRPRPAEEVDSVEPRDPPASVSVPSKSDEAGRMEASGATTFPPGAEVPTPGVEPSEVVPAEGARSTPPPPHAEVRAHELAVTRPARVPPGPECEPLDADLRRLHLTVSRGLLAKLEAARDGLSHVLPGATTEQVLEAALDLLLEKQARAAKLSRGMSKCQRPAQGTPAPRAGDRSRTAPSAPPAGRPNQGSSRGARAIPAAVEREVRLRDAGRCQFPLDSGGVCGSTTRLQLDHIVPVALGGQATVENLRLLCACHNRYAARLTLGEGVMASAQRRKGRRGKTAAG